MKLKIRIEKWEKAVVAQILEQDERSRTKSNTGVKSFSASNGFVVKSLSCPAFGGDVGVYLRGVWEGVVNDFNVFSKSFFDNYDRDEFFDKVVAALKEWSENAPEFRCDNCAKEDKRSNIYIF